MKKRLISIVTAMAAALSTAVSLGSSAYWESAGENYVSFMESEGYTLYPDQSLFGTDINNIAPNYEKGPVYFYKDSQNWMDWMRRVSFYDPVYWIVLADQPLVPEGYSEETDPVIKQLSEIFGEGCDIRMQKITKDNKRHIYGYNVYKLNSENDTAGFVKEAYSRAAEIAELKKFTYRSHRAFISADALNYSIFPDPAEYGMTIDELAEAFSELIAPTGISFTTCEESGYDANGKFTKVGLKLVLPAKINVGDILNALQLIHDEYGISFAMHGLESAGQPVGAWEIEAADSVDGDANCDGKLSIADATAIMQSIGNPDKYALTAQGTFNADVYEAGGGLTGMDAVTIMEKCVEKL